MISKWADFYIYKVRYDSQRNHIEKVKIYWLLKNTLGRGQVWSREEIVSAIKGDETFITVLRNDEGEWVEGEAVHIVTVNRKEYIRTDQNRRASDNLRNLPEF